MDFEIRKDRRPQGPRALVREREEYFRLMDQGFSTREAARIVGINLRTGKKWRNGHHSPGKAGKPTAPIHQERPSHPADPEVPPFRSSRYLNENERVHIADRIREGVSIRAVAAELGRSPSTVSREIRRNRRPMLRGGFAYQPFHAQRRAERRRARPKRGKIGTYSHTSPEMIRRITASLQARWEGALRERAALGGRSPVPLLDELLAPFGLGSQMPALPNRSRPGVSDLAARPKKRA